MEYSSSAMSQSLTRSRHIVPSPLVGEGQGGGREHSGASGSQSNTPQGGGPAPRQLTWLALEPLTGRTHQLRVHSAAMGWPVVGDNIYGSAPHTGGPPLHLHSREVVVPLYKNKDPVFVSA